MRHEEFVDELAPRLRLRENLTSYQQTTSCSDLLRSYRCRCHSTLQSQELQLSRRNRCEVVQAFNPRLHDYAPTLNEVQLRGERSTKQRSKLSLLQTLPGCCNQTSPALPGAVRILKCVTGLAAKTLANFRFEIYEKNLFVQKFLSFFFIRAFLDLYFTSLLLHDIAILLLLPFISHPYHHLAYSCRFFAFTKIKKID